MARRFPQSHHPIRRVLLLAVLMLPLLAGCTSGEETDADSSSLLPMTVVEWLFPPDADYAEADPLGVAQISWDPMRPGENTIAVTLTDLHGEPLPLVDEASALAIDVRQLVPDAEPRTLTPERDGATWTAEDVELGESGWYQLDIRLLDGAKAVAETRAWALLPDPSVYGAGAVELPESAPDAKALYERALDVYEGWETARWREGLSSGTGAVVVSDFSVTDRPNEPTAMLMDSRYVGSFRPGADGTAPDPPRLDFAVRITIGERLWSREEDGSWSVRDARPPATFEERADIYAGATNVVPGGNATVNGVETKIVTFYLPPKDGQSEAWFAWWIDPESGTLMRAVMIAQMHFMVWDFTDVNAPITIDPPPANSMATPTG